jgi:hypothetical protein
LPTTCTTSAATSSMPAAGRPRGRAGGPFTAFFPTRQQPAHRKAPTDAPTRISRARVRRNTSNASGTCLVEGLGFRARTGSVHAHASTPPCSCLRARAAAAEQAAGCLARFPLPVRLGRAPSCAAAALTLHAVGLRDDGRCGDGRCADDPQCRARFGALHTPCRLRVFARNMPCRQQPGWHLCGCPCCAAARRVRCVPCVREPLGSCLIPHAPPFLAQARPTAHAEGA